MIFSLLGRGMGKGIGHAVGRAKENKKNEEAKGNVASLMSRFVFAGDDIEEYENYGKTVGTVVGVVLDIAAVAGIAIGGMSMNAQNAQNKVTIEKNIERTANLSKFTHKAFTVSKEQEKYYAEMFGVALGKTGSAPTFSSITYEIDEDLYEKIFKYADITYKYGTSGQLVGATNEMRLVDWFLPNVQSFIAQNKIYKALAKATEKEMVAMRTYYSSEEINASVSSSAKGSYRVTSIGGVDVDEETKLASFTLDYVDIVEEDSTVANKRIAVYMPLTKEIEKDPAKAYEFYGKNSDKCEVYEIGVDKVVISRQQVDDKVYISTADAELMK